MGFGDIDQHNTGSYLYNNIVSWLQSHHFKHLQILNLIATAYTGTVTAIKFITVMIKKMYASQELHCYVYRAAVEILLIVSEVVIQCLARLTILRAGRIGRFSWSVIVDNSLTSCEDQTKHFQDQKKRYKGVILADYYCQKSMKR